MSASKKWSLNSPRKEPRNNALAAHTSLVAAAVLSRIDWPSPSAAAASLRLCAASFTVLLMSALNYSLLFCGEKYVSSGLATVLQATIPIFGILFAH
jgi:drug/metabolite transporter (DMT)-like permease